MAVNQLAIDLDGNAIYLPESVKRYRAWEEDGGEQIEMISRRLVLESRGNIWRVSYQYGYFDGETKNKVIESCIKGRKQPIRCLFLPPNSNDMIASDFFVMSFTSPKFMWSRVVPVDGEVTDDGEIITEKSVPIWADFGLELREVRPHD